MKAAILIQDVKIGQRFYMLNKNGLPKYNGKITYEMTRNNGRYFEYFRIENDKACVGTDLYPQYVILLESL